MTTKEPSNHPLSNVLSPESHLSLYSASEAGNEQLVEYLISNGADIDGCNVKRPLIAAASGGHANCVKLLLKHGAKVNQLDIKGNSALLVASRGKFWNTIEILINCGAKPSIQASRNLYEALNTDQCLDHLPVQFIYHLVRAISTTSSSLVDLSRVAFERSLLNLASYMLSKESDVIVRKHYAFALHYAAKYNWLEIASHLLEKGLDVNSTWNGVTALQVSCKEGNIEIVQLLLRRGANPWSNLLKITSYLSVPKPMKNTCSSRNFVDQSSEFIAASAKSEGYDYQNQHPLHVAFDSGEWSIVELLLSAGVDVNTPDSSDMTIQLKAIKAGQIDKVRRLADLGANVFLVNNSVESCLHLAIPSQDCLSTTDYSLARELEVGCMIQLLLSSGISCNTMCCRGETPLYRACAAGFSHVVRIMLNAGAIVNQSITGRYPLMAACETGKEDVVRLLLEKNSSMVNMCARLHSDGMLRTTPLSVAAMFGHHQTAVALLEHGALVNEVDEHHRTALLYATGFTSSGQPRSLTTGHLKTIELLLSVGANVECSDYSGETPLLSACCSGSDDVVQLLLSHRASCNYRNQRGETPLLIACRNNLLKTVQLLLEHGASPSVSQLPQMMSKLPYVDSTPLQEAVKSGNEQLTTLLLTWGAEVNETNCIGETALHFVPDSSFAIQLLKHCARINAATIHGETPLYRACCRGLLSVVETLLEHGASADGHFTSIPLYVACQNNDLRIVRALLAAGAKPNLLPVRDSHENLKRKLPANFSHQHSSTDANNLHSTEDNQFASSTTCNSGTWSQLESLKASFNGDSPLLTAVVCTAGDLSIIDALLQHGADVNFVDSSGKTVLHGLVDCLSKYAQSTSVTTADEHPIHYSTTVDYQHPNATTQKNYVEIISKTDTSRKKHKKFDYTYHQVHVTRVNLKHLEVNHSSFYVTVAELLIKYGADVNRRDVRGRTVFHYAVESVVKHPFAAGYDFLDFLLSCKSCIVNTLSNNFESPLYVASVFGNVEVVSKLLMHGAFEVGKRPLLAACQNEHVAVVDLLLRYGAYPDALSIPSARHSRNRTSDSPICVAARSGHVMIVELLLKHGAMVNIQDCFLKTPLEIVLDCFRPPDGLHDHGAVLLKLIDYGVQLEILQAENKQLLSTAVINSWSCDLIREMLRRGLDPNIPSRGILPLYEACKLGKEELVDVLLQGNANPDLFSGVDDELALCEAVNIRNLKIVEALVKKNADVNKRDGKGFAALHYACQNNDIELVKKLLTAGANPNLLTAQFTENKTELPLCVAAKHGNLHITDALLRSQAVTNAHDGWGRTALHCAVKYSKPSIKKPICDVVNDEYLSTDSDTSSEQSSSFSATTSSFDDVELRSMNGAVVSCSSSEISNVCHHNEVLILLLDYGADVNAVDSKGQTPLYMAVNRGYVEFVRLMLDGRGADPNSTTSKRYPLGEACLKKDTKLMQLLLEAGANPNESIAENEDLLGPIATMPLCIAAEAKDKSMITILLKYGANCNAVDSNGNSALNFLTDIEDSDFFEDDEDIVSIAKLLLQNGADPNHRGIYTGALPIGALVRHWPQDSISKLLKLLTDFGSRLDDTAIDRDYNVESSCFRLTQCIASSFLLQTRMFRLFKSGAGRNLLSAGCDAENSTFMFMSFEDDDCIKDFRLCLAIVLDGYRVSDADLRGFELIDLSYLPESETNAFLNFVVWLSANRKTPPSLLLQCRTTIRKQLLLSSNYRSILSLVDQLPLPDALKKYIRYEGPLSEVDMTDI